MVCNNCGQQLENGAVFCPNCGQNVTQGNQVPPQNTAPNQNGPQGNPVPPQYNPAPVVDPYDHTAEFNPEDVHDNKIFAILCYLTGLVGVIVALLARNSVKSPYLAFHIKQALKITITSVLVTIITALLCWTCIVPIAGAVCIVILEVVNIICFFKTCANKSIEAPIVRSLT
ncbi:MAG: zinc-ribbon domain-containing protein, partial [Ruminococcus sp.]